VIHVELIGARELKAKLENAGAKVREKIRSAVIASQYILRDAIQRLLSGEVLQNRTGNLERSITPAPVEETDTRITGAVGTNQIYARIQELGGTISAKNAANLTIPLEAALTPSGVAKFTAREVIENPGVAGMTGTFFAKGILFGKNQSAITPLFALKPSVTLPARPYISRALEEQRGEIEDRLSRALSQAMQEAQ
jgi:phage gpG-like protein